MYLKQKLCNYLSSKISLRVVEITTRCHAIPVKHFHIIIECDLMQMFTFPRLLSGHINIIDAFTRSSAQIADVWAFTRRMSNSASLKRQTDVLPHHKSLTTL